MIKQTSTILITEFYQNSTQLKNPLYTSVTTNENFKRMKLNTIRTK